MPFGARRCECRFTIAQTCVCHTIDTLSSLQKHTQFLFARMASRIPGNSGTPIFLECVWKGDEGNLGQN